MAQATRILFVSGEVKPFADVSDTAALVRTLPERLQESGDVETRIMMPRYGTISERKNRLHEVIRLSGTEIPMGEETETLKVKVASIPGIRLQVYFMDSKRYFKRKGVYADRKSKEPYEDNAERAIFFGRAVLETISKLRWGPDLIHLFGWMAAPIATLIRTEYAEAELFAKTKLVFTPDETGVVADVTDELVARLQLPDDTARGALQDLAAGQADAVALPGTSTRNADDALTFDPTGETLVDDIKAIYEQVLGVPA
ncbi:MAG: glycogen synthase [Bacteroidetes bacterium]|nr:MAG: glycogen synthase [Bacteroidota bacterium]